MATGPEADKRQARFVTAAVLFSLWFVVLLAGSPLKAWIHLVLLAALAVFPWRALSISPHGDE